MCRIGNAHSSVYTTPVTLRWISKFPVPFELHTPGTVFHFEVVYMARYPVGGWWLDSVGKARDPKAENLLAKNNEISNSTKVGGLLVKPANYGILDKDSATCS